MLQTVCPFVAGYDIVGSLINLKLHVTGDCSMFVPRWDWEVDAFD